MIERSASQSLLTDLRTRTISVSAMVRVDEFGRPTGLHLPEWETPIDAIRAGSVGNYGTSGDDYSDLSQHTQDVLDQAAYSLNTRPRQTLGGMTPSDKLVEAMQ